MTLCEYLDDELCLNCGEVYTMCDCYENDGWEECEESNYDHYG